MSKHTISAAAGGLPEISQSRRAILGGVPAMALLTSVPACAAVSSEIEKAFHELRASEEALFRIWDLEAELMDEYLRREPPRPQALYAAHGELLKIEPGKPGEPNRINLSDDGVEFLRELAAFDPLESLGLGRQGRVREILAAYEPWKAQCDALSASIGVDRCKDEVRRIEDKDGELFDHMLALRAETIRDAILQLVLIVHRGINNGQERGVLHRAVEVIGVQI